MRKRYIISAGLAGVLVIAAIFAWSGVAKSLAPVEVESGAISDPDVYTPTDLSVVEEEPFVPSKDEVLAAREQALEGMTPEDIESLTTTISNANLWWEYGYMYNNIFGRLEDPDSLIWNYFDPTQTGEIQIGWAVDADLDEAAVCEEENITRDEFYAKYGTKVVTEQHYDTDKFIAALEESSGSVKNDALKADLQYLANEMRLAVETHGMEHANSMYKMLHDMDYFLLRYGPEDVGKFVTDKSTVSKYYGMLSIYS